MGKVISFMLASADGFFEDSEGGLDWFNVSGDFMEYSLSQLRDFGLLAFGRNTYEHMVGYWPTPEAKQADPEVAGLMNSLPKVVFSNSLEKADWDGTTVVRDAPTQAIQQLAERADKAVAIFGVSLTASLLPSGVIDELRVMVNPVLLGQGRPLFPSLSSRVSLELVRTTAFESSNVLLCYRPLSGT